MFDPQIGSVERVSLDPHKQSAANGQDPYAAVEQRVLPLGGRLCTFTQLAYLAYF